jgi:hypothetical protein
MAGLDEWGLISGRGRNFCLHYVIQTDSGPDPISSLPHDGKSFTSD